MTRELCVLFNGYRLRQCTLTWFLIYSTLNFGSTQFIGSQKEVPRKKRLFRYWNISFFHSDITIDMSHLVTGPGVLEKTVAEGHRIVVRAVLFTNSFIIQMNNLRLISSLHSFLVPLGSSDRGCFPLL